MKDLRWSEEYAVATFLFYGFWRLPHNWREKIAVLSQKELWVTESSQTSDECVWHGTPTSFPLWCRPFIQKILREFPLGCHMVWVNNYFTCVVSGNSWCGIWTQSNLVTKYDVLFPFDWSIKMSTIVLSCGLSNYVCVLSAREAL